MIVENETYKDLYWRGKPCEIKKVGRVGEKVVAVWVTLEQGGEIIYIGKNSNDFTTDRAA
jgi:hypothetical protein